MNNWMGLFTLISREGYRFIRLSRQTVIPPIITTIMFILIFGYSLGSQIKEISGFPYIVFILPGLVQMSVITNSYANSSTSLYMARLERSIENVLVAPLHYLYVVSSFMMGGILRGLVVGFTIISVAAFFVDFPPVNWLLVFYTLFMTSFLLAGLGVISALRAESWDQIATFTNFVLTPFVYLGGVFYSIKMLPDFWQKVSHFNPLFYCVDLLRYAFLGISDTSITTSLIIVTIIPLLIFLICVYLFRKGYKIIS
ncbi:MAG: hypothetical protein ACD_73C00575G0003 [uncultured bacterium]|nr:MAG: hypothetical protein ACD_73C00575G0003 [uncultured bacterium]